MNLDYISKPHRRPDRHRRENRRFLLRVLVDGMVVLLFLLAVLATAEALCTWMGCPTDAYALR